MRYLSGGLRGWVALDNVAAAPAPNHLELTCGLPLISAPHVVAGALLLLKAAGVAERCETVGQDFFESVSDGGDAYMLAQILHDWDDGSKHASSDAYTTSKQGNLASVFSLSREIPRLHFRAVEPGVNPGSNLTRDMSAPIRVLSKAFAPIAPLFPYFSTPKRAARIITNVLTAASNATASNTMRTASG